MVVTGISASVSGGPPSRQVLRQLLAELRAELKSALPGLSPLPVAEYADRLRVWDELYRRTILAESALRELESRARVLADDRRAVLTELQSTALGWGRLGEKASAGALEDLASKVERAAMLWEEASADAAAGGRELTEQAQVWAWVLGVLRARAEALPEADSRRGALQERIKGLEERRAECLEALRGIGTAAPAADGSQWRKEIAELRAALEQARVQTASAESSSARLAPAQSRIEQLEAELKAAKERSQAVEQDLAGARREGDALRADLANSRVESEKTRGELEKARVELQELPKTVAPIPVVIPEVVEPRAGNAAALEAALAKTAELEAALKQADERALAAKRESQSLRAEMTVLREHSEKAMGERDQLKSQSDQTLGAWRFQWEADQARILELAKALEAAGAHRKKLEGVIKDSIGPLRAQFEAAKARIAELTQELARARGQAAPDPGKTLSPEVRGLAPLFLQPPPFDATIVLKPPTPEVEAPDADKTMTGAAPPGEPQPADATVVLKLPEIKILENPGPDEPTA